MVPRTHTSRRCTQAQAQALSHQHRHINMIKARACTALRWVEIGEGGRRQSRAAGTISHQRRLTWYITDRRRQQDNPHLVWRDDGAFNRGSSRPWLAAFRLLQATAPWPCLGAPSILVRLEAADGYSAHGSVRRRCGEGLGLDARARQHSLPTSWGSSEPLVFDAPRCLPQALPAAGDDPLSGRVARWAFAGRDLDGRWG